MESIKNKQEFITFIIQSAKRKKGFTKEKLYEASFEKDKPERAFIANWKGPELLNVKVESEKECIEYTINYPIVINKNNFLNAVMATCYINDVYTDTRYARAVFSCDFKKKILGIKTKYIFDGEKLSCGNISKQIKDTLEIYEFFYEALYDYLTEHGDAEIFREEIGYVTEKSEMDFRGKEEFFENAFMASKQIGVTKLLIKNGAVAAWKLTGKTPLSLLFHLEFCSERNGFIISHIVPAGFLLENGVDVALATDYLNHKLEYGRFNVDLQKGRVHYQIVIDPLGTAFSQKTFEKNFCSVIQTLSNYYPIYVKYLRGEYTNKEYISLVEGY